MGSKSGARRARAHGVWNQSEPAAALGHRRQSPVYLRGYQHVEDYCRQPGAGAVSAVLADAPYVFDKTPGRLPKDVIPTDYDLVLVPDIARKQISGHESIKLSFRAPSAKIQFDTHDLTVSEVRFDGHPISAVNTDNARAASPP